MSQISFEEFKKIDLRIGKVLSAEKVEGTDKLLKMIVNFGEEKRQIVSGIAEFFKVSELVGNQFPFIVNLKPRKIHGLESQAMILAVDLDEGPVLMKPEREVPSGSFIG